MSVSRGMVARIQRSSAGSRTCCVRSAVISLGARSLQQPNGKGKRVKREIGRDRHQPENRDCRAGLQRCRKQVPQIARLANFIGGDSKHVFIDEALPGQRTVETDRVSGTDRLACSIEQGAPRHRQETLHVDVADWRGIKQRGQQRVAGKGGKAVGAEQGLPRDIVVKPDEVDANTHQAAGPSPVFGQSPDHERPQRCVGGHATRATEAGDKKAFGFVRLFDLQGSFRGVQCGRRLALCQQRRGKVVEGHDEIRPDLERAAVAPDRFVEATHAAQRGAQAVVSLRKVRPERRGPCGSRRSPPAACRGRPGCCRD